MTDQDDLVDRANKLMRADGRALGRRRSFLASPGQPPAPFTLPPPGFADDELPVLTEVVAADDFAPPSQAAVAAVSADAGRPDEAASSLLAADVMKSLEEQLAAELPTLIEATLLNAQGELLAGVHSTLELALRNFLASRQLPPPPDPDTDLLADA